MREKETMYTPGPWLVDENITDARSRGYIRGENRVAVARANSTGRGYSEMKANARLIAAAPDLLATAKYALSQLEAMGQITNTGDVCGALREAIAKAEPQ